MPLVVVAVLLPLQVAEREILLALVPEVGRQTGAGCPLEWAAFLPPERVWEEQMAASEEGLVAAGDQWAHQGLRRRWAVDPPALGPDLWAALHKKVIHLNREMKAIRNEFNIYPPCPPLGGMGCCCGGGPPYGG